jgi:DNA polymerase-3 subunit epsilon
LFAVVDIETTGSHASANSITEIAIYVTDGLTVKQKFSTLLNPLRPIPYTIQRLTGIDDNMVSDAPRFDEKAGEIRDILAEHIFVAHNVTFDLGFVQAAFKAMGIDYNPRRLCTVRYGRRVMPGLRSYSLANLCKHFNLRNLAAHRAEGDTEVTAIILHKLLGMDKEGQWQNMIKLNKGELNLPANLPAQEYHDLPMAAGVYYFYNQKGEVLYIGKASRIKNRVASHFGSDKNSAKSMAFKREISHIHYRLCGNILVAGLLEDHEIRKNWPPFNQAQKNPKLSFGVFAYRNQKNDWCLGINKIGKQQAFLAKFHNLEKARSWLAEMVKEQGLNANLCGFPKPDSGNNLEHNKAVDLMLKDLQKVSSASLWLGEGRTENEKSFIYLNRQGFKGIGFIPKDFTFESPSELEPYLEGLERSATTDGILQEGLKKLRLELVKLPSEIESSALLF